MRNRPTRKFRQQFEALTVSEQQSANRAYGQYLRDPSLVNFEQKGRDADNHPVYGARITRDLRALAVVVDGVVWWWWIGHHGDYDRILKPLRK